MEKQIVLQQEVPGTIPYDPSASLRIVQDSLNKLADAANVQAVYAEPIKNGDTLVVPAAEVLTVVAFGAGSGGGKDAQTNMGSGGGGGGVGRAFARPVAAIVVTPSAVRVEPIVDVTKVALAALTAAGFMLAMIARMNRQRAPRLNEP
ncbi:MAG: hypothetical protein HY868_11515 [Chloroflexi bacterium]|nr:hypothetical protein [Chloroflexota bacterium]